MTARLNIEHDESAYRRSHGHTPKGCGAWAFGECRNPDMGDIIWTPSMTYTDAKKYIKAKLKSDGVVGTFTVYTQP